MNYQNPLLDRLFDTILSLKTREECYMFFEDACTVKEMLDIAQRLEVAKMLADKQSYVQIAKETGMSTATISRVNRSLNYGNDGYEMVMERIRKNKTEDTDKAPGSSEA